MGQAVSTPGHRPAFENQGENPFLSTGCISSVPFPRPSPRGEGEPFSVCRGIQRCGNVRGAALGAPSPAGRGNWLPSKTSSRTLVCARGTGSRWGAIKRVGHGPRGFCPGGTSGNSPAFQRRGGQNRDRRPEGTVENTRCPQPSLWDGPLFRFPDPALKRRAILASPSGAKRRRELSDGFNRTPAAASARHRPRRMAPFYLWNWTS